MFSYNWTLYNFSFLYYRVINQLDANRVQNVQQVSKFYMFMYKRFFFYRKYYGAGINIAFLSIFKILKNKVSKVGK